MIWGLWTPKLVQKQYLRKIAIYGYFASLAGICTLGVLSSSFHFNSDGPLIIFVKTDSSFRITHNSKLK